jgi:hypothetical protein
MSVIKVNKDLIIYNKSLVFIIANYKHASSLPAEGRLGTNFHFIRAVFSNTADIAEEAAGHST